MDGDKYLVFNEQNYIHEYKDKMHVRMGLYDTVILNQLQEDVIKLCDGGLTVQEIWNKICILYQTDDNEENSALFQQMIERLINGNILHLAVQKEEVKIRKFGKRMKAYPVWIICEVTNKCNFACPHCYKEAHMDGCYLDMDKMHRIVSEFAGFSPNIVLTGGEALMHPQIEDILKMTVMNFETTLMTNGYLLDRIDIELLSRLKRLQVSMYGYDDESYYSFTKNRNGFSRLSSGFEKIRKCKGLEMVLTVGMTRENINQLDKYVEAAIGLGAPALFFGVALPVGRANEGNDIFEFNEREGLRAYNLVSELRRQYEAKIRIMPFENQGDYVPLHQKSLGCQGGKSNIVINEKGMVRPCNMLPSYLFSEYSLERYINDVKHGIERNYELDLENVRRYMERNGKKAEDMKCSGFCHVR